MCTRRIAVALLSTLTVLAPAVALAGYRDFAPVHGNFQHTPNLRPDDTPPGLLLSGRQVLYGSTTIADVDGNSANGKEVLVLGGDATLYVRRQDGAEFWEKKVSSCTPANNEEQILTAPTVADVNGDGAPDVVVGYGTRSNACQGGISAFNGADGSLLWNYPVPLHPSFPQNGSGVLTTPSVADVDGQGDIVVAFGSNNLYFHVLNKDGSLRWRFFSMDTHHSSPAFADVNGDGTKEIIFGTDFTPGGQVCNPQNPLVPRPEDSAGFLYAFPADPVWTPDPVCARDGDLLDDQGQNGSDGRNETIGFDKGWLWKVPLDQSVYSSPALTDIDNDGALEVIVGASCYYAGRGNWVKIFTAASGALERTLNASNCVIASPAIGDINGDGKLEIVATVGSGFPGVDPNLRPITHVPTGPSDPRTNPGKVIAWSFDNPTPLWEITPKAPNGEQELLTEATNSPIIADLDGNGSLEVALVVANSVTVLRGDTGAQLTASSASGAGSSLFMWAPNRSTPAVGDLDDDGKLELVVGASHDPTGQPSLKGRAFLYAWRDFAGILGSPQGSGTPYSAPWPMFKGNPAHTGLLSPRIITPSMPQINAIVGPNVSRSFSIRFSSPDGSSFNWEASESDPNNNIRLSRTSGSSADELVVTLSTNAGLRQGGGASISVSADGFGTASIPVSVIAGSTVRDLFVPLNAR
jgi:outer membrane protein assembly factor BamB